MLETAPALVDLLGKPLWASGRAANMQWFQFGRRRSVVSSLPSRAAQAREVGELALHLQSPWRLRVGADVVVGSYDLNFPRGVSRPADVPPEFDWDKASTLLDERVESIEKQFLPARVVDVSVGVAGCFSLGLEAGLALEVFPNASVASESWRLFAPGESSRDHLVYESGPRAP